MEPTSISNEMEKFFSQFLQKKLSDYFVTKVQALEDENENLKLRISELERNCENGCCGRVEVQEEEQETQEKCRITGPVLPKAWGKILVEEEPLDEFIPEEYLQIQIETPSIDEDIDIDLKEEEVGFGRTGSKSDGVICNTDPVLLDTLNIGQSTDTPMKNEIDKSIQRMFQSDSQVLNNETSQVGTSQVETVLDFNYSSSSTSKRNVPCEKSAVNPQPQVSNHGLSGQKRPCLFTRPAEKIHTCKTCFKSFDTQFKLMVHNNKSHTGEKGSRTNLKTSFKCSVPKKNFSTQGILTDHLKTHAGEKRIRTSLRYPFKCQVCSMIYKTEKLLTDHTIANHTRAGHTKVDYTRTLRSRSERLLANCKRSLTVGKEKAGGRRKMGTRTGVKEKSSESQVADKGFSAKRSLTVENEKVNPEARPKNQRSVETGLDKSSYEEMSRVGVGIHPKCAIETNSPKIKKKLMLNEETRRITRTNCSIQIGNGFSVKGRDTKRTKKVIQEDVPKKQLTVETEAELFNDEEMPGEGEGKHALLEEPLVSQPLKFGPFELIRFNEMRGVVEEIDLT